MEDAIPASPVYTPEEILALAVCASPNGSTDPGDLALLHAARERGVALPYAQQENSWEAPSRERPYSTAMLKAADKEDATPFMVARGSLKALEKLCEVSHLEKERMNKAFEEYSPSGFEPVAVAVHRPGAPWRLLGVVPMHAMRDVRRLSMAKANFRYFHVWDWPLRVLHWTWVFCIIGLASTGICIAEGWFLKMGDLRPGIRHLRPDGPLIRRIAVVSVLTGAQQSIMNFGILMIQSLVNSFGVNVMAAFAAGVKIDAFAYAPAQDFANGFATFVAQNAGAGRADRVRRGLREAAMMSLGFCALVSAVVGIFAVPLLSIFIDPSQGDVMAVGVHYLRTEGLCYVGIGLLFLLYATYRGLERAGMSIVLTVISLGLRVALAYWLAPSWGLDAVWWAIPIGWAVADATGLMALKHSMTSLRTR